MGLSLVGPLALLAVAARLGGFAALAFLACALGSLGIAAGVLGVDSRDGRDW